MVFRWRYSLYFFGPARGFLPICTSRPTVANAYAWWGGPPQQQRLKHMTTHVLKRDRQSFSVNFKILLKHTADALPLIEHQLSPFKDYRCNVAPWIEGETSGKTLSIYTKPIRYPLDSRKFSVSATVSIRDQYAYMKVPYDPHLTLLSHIDDLSGNIICDEFCSLHRTEFRRVFHALCNYEEGAKAIEDKPF